MVFEALHFRSIRVLIGFGFRVRGLGKLQGLGFVEGVKWGIGVYV